ncbi:MAG: universal stress protein [Acidimicrobiia bacterium]
MSPTVALLVFFAAWVAIGLVASLVMGRRGHNPLAWLLVGAGLGPLTLVAARASILDAREARPVVADRGSVGPGPLKVLIGVDGSDASMHALEFVVRLLGSRVGRLEIATVVDYDTTTPRDDAGHSEEILAAAAVAAGRFAPCSPGTVMLPGKPSTALLEHAHQGAFDLLAIGSHGRGVSKLVFGSVARALATETEVPVIIVGADARMDRAEPRRAVDRDSS